MDGVMGGRRSGEGAGQGGGQDIVVDRIHCDGFGMCAELLPELIELDDWGYPIVAAGPVPDQLLEHARRAVAVCPVLALRLRAVARATMTAGG
jgi:ferredoxin